ncbi:MAG: ABC transporter substrate-binding protein [Roseiflexaceae bacterium]
MPQRIGRYRSGDQVGVDRVDVARISRRRFLIGAAALGIGMVSGCGGAAPVSSPTPAALPTAQATTTPTPAAAVVALDEFAGLSVLSLGIKPVSVFLTFGYGSAKAVFEAAGVATTAAAPDGVNLEAVAALKPSAIIGVSIPTTAAAESTLNSIAPTTVIAYTAPWQEQLQVTGAALGRSAEAAALSTRLADLTTALKNDLASAGAADQTISVIGAIESDIFALSRSGSVGSLLEQVGLKRPAAQDVVTEPTNPFIPISAERINDHDADRIILLSGGAYQSDSLTGSALWPALTAVKEEQVIMVVAELWFSSNAFGIDWIIRDLRAALLSDGSVASESDVVSRWQAFAQ